jgi:16S rRNA (uracil1498-N3)-methyltransferase
MRMNRVWIEAPLNIDAALTLSESATTHLVRVLRLGVGDSFLVFNGDGHDYEARLLALGKRGAQAQIIGRRAVASESPLRITLAQAMARGEKMDWLLQKATELGVSRIVPLITERTEVKLDSEREEKRVRHWQAVIAAACEQCGRAILPGLSQPIGLPDWLAAQSQAGWFLHPEAGVGLSDVRFSTADLSVVVGPEGGFGERDLAALGAAGFTGLRLGPRVLRTETAGLAAIAALQARLGDLG